MMVSVRRLDCVDELSALAVRAQDEGFGFVQRLVDEWTSGANRFDKKGEVLLGADDAGRLVGVCGLNIDPYSSDPAVGRVRRLYVDPGVRRSGVATILVRRIIGHARGHFLELRLRSRDPRGAAFYRARGFSEVADDKFCTHRLGLG